MSHNQQNGVKVDLDYGAMNIYAAAIIWQWNAALEFTWANNICMSCIVDKENQREIKRGDWRHKAILHRWRHQQRDEQPLRTCEITLTID